MSFSSSSTEIFGSLQLLQFVTVVANRYSCCKWLRLLQIVTVVAIIATVVANRYSCCKWLQLLQIVTFVAIIATYNELLESPCLVQGK